MGSDKISNHHAFVQALARAVTLQTKQHVMHHTALTFLANSLE